MHWLLRLVEAFDAWCNSAFDGFLQTLILMALVFLLMAVLLL